MNIIEVEEQVPAEVRDYTVKVNGQVVWDYKDREDRQEIQLIHAPIPSIDDPTTWNELIQVFMNDGGEGLWTLADEASGEPIIRYALTEKKTGDKFLEFFTF